MGSAQAAMTVITLPIRYRASSRWVPLFSLLVGLGLLRLGSSFGYAVLFVAVVAAGAVVNLERYRRSTVASMRALVAPPQPDPVTLVPIVTDARLGTRLRMQFLLRDEAGVDRAMAWMAPDRERFDPRAPVFVHGDLEPGRSIALTGASGLTALLPYGRLRPVPAGPSPADKRTRALVRMLGWDAAASDPTSKGPAMLRAGSRVGPDQFGGDTAARPALDPATEASMERVEWVRRHVDSSPLGLVVLIAIGFTGGLAWWLPIALLALALFGIARLRAWQVRPLAQLVVAEYGGSTGEATKLAMAFLGLRNAKLPPAG